MTNTSPLIAAVLAAPTAQCPFCDGAGRLANPWCTGDQAGGGADPCDECRGLGKTNVYAEYADLYQEQPVEETRGGSSPVSLQQPCPWCGAPLHEKMCPPQRAL